MTLDAIMQTELSTFPEKEVAMSRKWQDATQEYQQAKQTYLQSQIEIDKATRDLEHFIASDEGSAAMALLEASDKHIIFGEEDEGEGFSTPYFIDGNGLQKFLAATDTWTAYAEKVSKPKLFPITAQQAVKAAMRDNIEEPSEVLDWLRKKLDEIADSAPQMPAPF